MAQVPRHTHRAPHAPPKGDEEVECRGAGRGSVRRENRAAGEMARRKRTAASSPCGRARSTFAPSAARICVRDAHDAACAARPGVGARDARLQLLSVGVGGPRSIGPPGSSITRAARSVPEGCGGSAWLSPSTGGLRRCGLGGAGDGEVTDWARRWRLRHSKEHT